MWATNALMAVGLTDQNLDILDKLPDAAAAGGSTLTDTGSGSVDTFVSGVFTGNPSSGGSSSLSGPPPTIRTVCPRICCLDVQSAPCPLRLILGVKTASRAHTFSEVCL